MPIITEPTRRSRATQDDILLAFADRLREHELLNHQNVVISDQPVPDDMPGGGFCLAVAPGPGQYPRELWESAGHAQATEDGSVIVGVYTKIVRDRRGRKEFSLFGRREQDASPQPDARRPNLMAWKRAILKLLVVGEPTLASSGNVALSSFRQSWEPSRDGIPLCRDIPTPIRSTGVLDVPDFPGWIGLQITFAVAWDWDLYA
jgi:hypothetical protein